MNCISRSALAVLPLWLVVTARLLSMFAVPAIYLLIRQRGQSANAAIAVHS